MSTWRRSGRPDPRQRALRWLLGSIAAAGGAGPMLATAQRTAVPAPVGLALDVTLNGQATGLIARFATVGGGRLAITREELAAIGFDPAKLPDGALAPIALDALGVTYRYDEAGQSIAMTAPAALLRTVRISTRPAAPSVPLAAREVGAVLNYTLLGAGSLGGDGKSAALSSAAAQIDARVFGGFGLFTGSLIATAPTSGRANVVRLDTSWTLEDPDRLLALRAGDLIGGGLSWTRPIRLGGIQFARSFALRPDLVTMPVPTLRGTAQAPSTLDLFVGGMRTLSSAIPAGPFEVDPQPGAVGGGVAQVVVRDVLGRETRLDLPFYASDALLARGLMDYSVELGFARRSFGLRSSDYDPRLAASGTIRFGLTDSVTLQGHTEATGRLLNVGAGGVVTLGQLAVASVAVAGSTGPAGQGANVDIGIESRRGRFAARLRSVRTFGRYEDLAAISAYMGWQNDAFATAFRPPTAIDQAQLSGSLWSPGSTLSLSYARVRRDGEDARLATVAISQTFSRATVSLRGWQDFTGDGERGVTMGFTWALGPRLFSSSEISAAGAGGLAGVTELSSAGPVSPGEFGWRARLAEGNGGDRFAAAQLPELLWPGGSRAPAGGTHHRAVRAGLGRARLRTPRAVRLPADRRRVRNRRCRR